ncbi:MAG: tRNA pseudouridine(38-40) synthase TruA [Candidatus Paracaedibacteraceae bacterium]|nr:tRNA pseudouridine(38-40) synthase TruA [Candidatus Paracaedibacteraceae bacterium]
MPRYKFIIEYNGSAYHGWQYQENLPTIQGEIESAIFKITQESIRLQVSGRTDAGVHALGQVAHADINKLMDPFRLTYGLNHFLTNKGISILSTETCDTTFHARFSTKARTYLYKIINRRAPLTVDMKLAYHVPLPLDVTSMNEAAKYLIGHHDFTSFRASECQALSPKKTLEQAEFKQSNNLIEFHTRSKSFLHHQVRNMVGTLCLVGVGKWQPKDIQIALLAKNRKAAGPTAPPDGLYLREIIY